MDRREVTRAISGLTSSSIVTLDIDGEMHSALIREKQRNYLRNELIHIDFQAVSLKEKIRSKIVVILTGSAPAVKNFNGIVFMRKNSLKLKHSRQICRKIVVDISNLEKIGDQIRNQRLKFSDKITVFDDSNDYRRNNPGIASEQTEENLQPIHQSLKLLKRARKKS
jgi:large subunit ribosomal protein L25